MYVCVIGHLFRSDMEKLSSPDLEVLGAELSMLLLGSLLLPPPGCLGVEGDIRLG